MVSTAYRFGKFRLNPAARELWRGEEEIPLHRKAFDCIVYLIEHRDRAVARDEIFAAVWGDLELSDGVLGQSILEARRALDDTGEGQQVIKTVRAFGYRWVASVETLGPAEQDEIAKVTAEAVTSSTPKPKPIWLWPLIAVTAIGTLFAVQSLLRWGTAPVDPDHLASQMQGGDLALVLPVDVSSNEQQGWIRLGVMELLAERFRAAGQPVVPSDTVIALLGGSSTDASTDALDRLTAATDSRLVLGACAEATAGGWRISLRTLRGFQPELATVGEAQDVLEAAADAADRMAVTIGLAPAPEPSAHPDLVKLLHQAEAAMLAAQYGEAKTLLAGAVPALRRNPEVRLLRTRVDIASYDLGAAQAELESLLEEPAVKENPVLQGRTVHGLAAVHFRRDEYAEAQPLAAEAARLFQHEGSRARLGHVHLMLGSLARMRGDFDAASMHLERARIAFEGTGDILGLSGLDNLQGNLAMTRERYAEALPSFEIAAERDAALNSVGNELRNRANIIYAHLNLLETKSAVPVETRLSELATQTSNPQLLLFANLIRAYLRAAQGQHLAAESLLTEVVRATESDKDLRPNRPSALVLLAEIAARDGDLARAANLAAQVIDEVPAERAAMHEELGRAWLLHVRANLSLGRLATATHAAAALTAWTQRSPVPSAQVYGALAQAELAVAQGNTADARAAFERAFALAEASQVPRRVLQVAEVYIPWLLPQDRDRAVSLTGRIAGYADQDFTAALLQLRVSYELGSVSAWRGALARAHSLAGERQIPSELLDAPEFVALRP